MLFCPFCREAFEATTRCPDHELELVAWHQLPREVPTISDDALLAPYSMAVGRGWVFVGVALTLIAFVLPMLTLSGATELHANMLRFASLRAGKLWMVPLSGLAQLTMMFRRRTPSSLRSVRVAVAAVALMPSLALAVTLLGVKTAADALSERTGELTSMTIEWGSYLVFAAAIPMLVGALRLGVTGADAPANQHRRE